jgi:hypothetical protein
VLTIKKRRQHEYLAHAFRLLQQPVAQGRDGLAERHARLTHRAAAQAAIILDLVVRAKGIRAEGAVIGAHLGTQQFNRLTHRRLAWRGRGKETFQGVPDPLRQCRNGVSVGHVRDGTG